MTADAERSGQFGVLTEVVLPAAAAIAGAAALLRPAAGGSTPSKDQPKPTE